VQLNTLLSLAEMEILAREATRAALAGYRQPANIGHLTLGSELRVDLGVFELYIAGERPADAQVISRANVNRHTGEIEVQVFLEKA
jgi:hypothetical protein